MMRLTSLRLLFSIIVCVLLSGGADARDRPIRDAAVPASLVETFPSLAPFQHVRFCIHYPADCRSNSMEDDHVDATRENLELLEHINRGVNVAIVPVHKSYGKDLQEAWTIAPFNGDCNDYAVTKRHELIRSGLPAKALRLAVVETKSGSGHLVLLVVTTTGDLVLDNLTEAIVPWQSTDYRWLKVQSAIDARSWYEVRVSGGSPLRPD
jgi:predicted transglutaminase-like cysteine proteinase